LIVTAAFALVAFGWVAGRSQAPAPDFELVVNSPEGETVIQCVGGCKLVWAERGINPNAQPLSEFKYRCGGRERCSSGKVAGWIGH